MNAIELQNTLLEELEYANAPGFKAAVSWQNDRPIDGITSVYCIQDVPIAYFSQLEEFASNKLLQLYRSVWSQSKAPLLYVVLPQEIRVYNSYAEPPDPEQPDELDKGDRLLQHLQQLLDVETARQAIYHKLSDYRRVYLDTGAFWNTADGQRIKREQRADKRLLKAMDQVRRALLNEHLSPHVAYALLGRVIFIRYLEDRGILNKDAWVAQITHGRVSDYFAALENKATTYLLFDYLSQRFNGDIFPVEDEERQQVNEPHLQVLSKFLKGHDLDTGQQSFWPYDFTYIPIELISGIYDTFLSQETRQELGTYNTPLSLVDFIIEEALPVEKTRPEMTILDPACGSGIFLVRAYQRLVEAWKQQHVDMVPTVPQLSALVTANSHEQFRQDFFNQYRVRAVVNFSSLVYELFPDSLSPVVALFYCPESADVQKKVVYAIPKPSPISQHMGEIVLDANEVKFLKMEEFLAILSFGKLRHGGHLKTSHSLKG